MMMIYSDTPTFSPLWAQVCSTGLVLQSPVLWMWIHIWNRGAVWWGFRRQRWVRRHAGFSCNTEIHTSSVTYNQMRWWTHRIYVDERLKRVKMTKYAWISFHLSFHCADLQTHPAARPAASSGSPPAPHPTTRSSAPTPSAPSADPRKSPARRSASESWTDGRVDLSSDSEWNPIRLDPGSLEEPARPVADQSQTSEPTVDRPAAPWPSPCGRQPDRRTGLSAGQSEDGRSPEVIGPRLRTDPGSYRPIPAAKNKTYKSS